MDVRTHLFPALVAGLSRTAGLCDADLRAWRWVLVAPSPLAPEGFVNVATGQTHPVVW